MFCCFFSQGKIVVGHDLRRDFNVLGFQPQPEFIRDTSTFRGMMGPGANRRSLKSLALEHLDLQIQVGPHCSIQDARAAMSLYRLVRHEWETNRLAENSSKNGNQGDWLSYVNRTMTDTWTKMYGICFNIKDVEADVVAEDKDISGLGGNENVDRIANDDYWVIKNPRDYKVGLSNIQQVFFENSESKLSVLNNKIKMDSGVVIKAKSITTKKSKKNFCGF
ncbi:hypothetical protein DPMN_074778 [Dreissena polymorpha]|uniref:Exonuclease domain-containing protein n=1 Tax=Dreissena polymorpha TaxID=45954 RepID=A0A9D3YGW8_DREPO|nr:hypothetical protein DPMN_074778 [Dreissena polymorpha]